MFQIATTVAITSIQMIVPAKMRVHTIDSVTIYNKTSKTIFMVREYIASPAKKPRTKNSESIQNTTITKLNQENSCWLGGAPKLAYSTAIPTENPTDVSAPIVQTANTFGEG
jgi:hypothetical protein